MKVKKNTNRLDDRRCDGTAGPEYSDIRELTSDCKSHH